MWAIIYGLPLTDAGELAIIAGVILIAQAMLAGMLIWAKWLMRRADAILQHDREDVLARRLEEAAAKLATATIVAAKKLEDAELPAPHPGN